MAARGRTFRRKTPSPKTNSSGESGAGDHARPTPPLSESLHTGNLARNALYDSDGLEITKKFLTKYIGELSAERTRRRKAQGLGGGLLKNVDSNLILLRHSDACDPDC